MVDFDITEGIPYTLSNPSTTPIFTPNTQAYDMAINGQPFFVAASDDSPYRRVTAQYRKQQYDQTREAGEQSLTGWWFRSQSSFHLVKASSTLSLLKMKACAFSTPNPKA
jgi:hypothetical protein